jgi:hypothetical protein
LSLIPSQFTPILTEQAAHTEASETARPSGETPRSRRWAGTKRPVGGCLEAYLHAPDGSLRRARLALARTSAFAVAASS